MLVAVAVLCALNLLLLILLFTRKHPSASADSRLSSLPDAVLQLQARVDSLDGNLRAGVGDLRREMNEAATHTRDAAARSSEALRAEVQNSIATLGKTLHDGLNSFRTDNQASSETLRAKVDEQLNALGLRLSDFVSKVHEQQRTAQETLHNRLNDLGDRTQQRLTELGTRQDARLAELGTQQRDALDRLNKDNSAKLDEMRATVDEKLQKTLDARLTESFGQVTTHLGEVQKGLGEMKELATGVNDLKRVFTNVKTRGGVGEFLLGELISQMFAPDQYIKNASVRSGTQEKVEYALKVPSSSGDTLLLAIDSKFPQADWERLEDAYQHGDAETIAAARKNLERAVRIQGESICKKYIHEPETLPYAVMFLPTEALYAEVLRSPGLVTGLQQDCQVMVVGPSTFMHIMANFRMAFRTMAIQAKGGDVIKVLGNAKREFEAFGTLMSKVRDQVTTVQNTLDKIRSKTTTINRALKTVDSEIVEISTGTQENLLDMEEMATVPPFSPPARNNASASTPAE